VANPDAMVHLGLDPPPVKLPAPRTRLRRIGRDGFVLIAFVIVGALAAIAIGPGHILSLLQHRGIPAPANAVLPVANAGPKLLIRLDIAWNNQHSVDYLSDGTVIRWNRVSETCQRGQRCGTLERNSLTATGLASLRALLDRDSDLLAKPRAANMRVAVSDGRVRGFVNMTLALQRPDGSHYAVTFPDAQPDVVRTDTNAPYFEELNALAASDPAINRLNALAVALSDPAKLAGADGLVDPTWETYRPASMAVFVTIYHQPEHDPTSLDPDTTPPDLNDWPFEGDPETFGGAFSDAPGLAPDQVSSRCAFLPSGDVESAISGLTGPKGRAQWADSMASGIYWERSWRWTAQSPTTGISMRVVGLLPEDSGVSCLDALAY